MQRLGEVDFPFIVFHSENDTMVDVDGSKALYLRAQASCRAGQLGWGVQWLCHKGTKALAAGTNLHVNPAFPSHFEPAPALPSQTLQSKDKTLRLINSFWHILVREPGNEKINAAISDWLLERAQ